MIVFLFINQAILLLGQCTNLDGYRDTLDVLGFLPLGQTSPEHCRVNPTNYYSLEGTDLLDPQNSFISGANGDWNMSGFPNGSVILAPSDTLENASEKEAPSTAPVSPVKLVTEASQGEISSLTPWIAIILAWECYPSTAR